MQTLFLKNLKKKCFQILFMFAIWLTVSSFCAVLHVTAAPRIQQPGNGDHFVIVIDPGHGGENKGTIENGYLEKEMTLTTALALYEELEKYDNIEIYLTRTEDIDLSLKERAEFAASHQADFLFSIHYNASVDHDLFGSEIWIPSFPPYNAYGYQFGMIQMQSMRDMGLFLRGIKTKQNDRGTDFYGIIRESNELNIPAVILEHCHVDEERDYVFCDTKKELEAFGKTDATNIAKYLGLSSSKLGVDYSNFSLNLADASANLKVQSTFKDETPPDVCQIELLDTDYDNGILKIQLTAADYDSPMLYYQYSYNGGLDFSPLQEWPQVDVLENTYADTFSFTLQVPSRTQPYVIVRVYNLFDNFTDSNPIDIPYVFHYGEEEEVIESSQENVIPTNSLGTTTFMPDKKTETKEGEISFIVFIKICLILAAMLLLVVMIATFLYDSGKRRRKRQRRKEAGNKKNQPR